VNARVLGFTSALGLVLVVLAVTAGMLGAFPVGAGEVVSSVLHRTGLERLGVRIGTRPGALAESVLWDIRFPRVALSLVVGGSLGAAGAVMQGTLGNPLAEPGLVGVSSGAALAAVVTIVMAGAPLGSWTLTVAAFAGGCLATLAVYTAARRGGRTEVVTLILTGVAINAMAGALIGLCLFVSDAEQLRSITFWTLGSVAQASWVKVGGVMPVAAAGLVLATRRGRDLDLFALGEHSARHLGVPVERRRLELLVVVAALTAAAVAVAGIISFVGLVVPHLVRMAIGPAHRPLIVASALAGGVVLVGGDLLARTVVAPAELPLGVLTALVGSPVFFWQLRRTRARQGGWA
jgi:iron complex transport system permease protein